MKGLSIPSIKDKMAQNQELQNSIDKIKQFNEALVSKYGLSTHLDFNKLIEDANQTQNLNLYTVNQNYQVRGEIIPGANYGGDFFDMFAIGPNKIGLIIGDVSEKSVPAVLFMTIAKTMAHSLAKSIVSPKELMEKANLLLSHYNTSCMFLTAFYAVFDSKTGLLTYCNAGHYPPYLLSSNGQLKKITEPAGMALGLKDFLRDEAPPYEENIIQLKSKDCLVMYTDGVITASNQEGEDYSPARLEKALVMSSQKPFCELIESVADDIHSFTGMPEQRDDITIFSLRYL